MCQVWVLETIAEAFAQTSILPKFTVHKRDMKQVTGPVRALCSRNHNGDHT